MQYARHPSRCLRWMMKKKKICLYGNYILLNLISRANSYTTLKYITCRQDAYITFICHLLNSRYQDNQNLKLKVIFNLPNDKTILSLYLHVFISTKWNTRKCWDVQLKQTFLQSTNNGQQQIQKWSRWLCPWDSFNLFLVILFLMILCFFLL